MVPDEPSAACGSLEPMAAGEWAPAHEPSRATSPVAAGQAGEGIELSVLIVSWNVRELLLACVDSVVRALAGHRAEIIVCDNASADGSVAALRERHPEVVVIENRENVGFARANNQALLASRGSFVLLLNPDTVVDVGFLAPMMRAMQQSADVAVVGPRIRLPQGVTQSSCARRLPRLSAVLAHDALRLTRLPGIGAALERRLRFPYDYQREQEVEAISGACMLVRREALCRMPLFDEVYLHCGEDIDFCHRIRSAGYKVVYTSESTVVHHCSASSRQAPIRTQVNSLISRGRYFSRCCGPVYGFLFRLIIVAVWAPLSLVGGVWQAISLKEPSLRLRGRLRLFWMLLRWRELGPGEA